MAERAVGRARCSQGRRGAPRPAGNPFLPPEGFGVELVTSGISSNFWALLLGSGLVALLLRPGVGKPEQVLQPLRVQSVGSPGAGVLFAEPGRWARRPVVIGSLFWAEGPLGQS